MEGEAVDVLPERVERVVVLHERVSVGESLSTSLDLREPHINRCMES